MTTKSNTATSVVGKEYTIIREFAAPRKLVWRACTEPDHLAQWWGPKGFTTPVCEWDVRPGGKIYVVMRGPDGTDYPMGGEFREIVPPSHLVTITGALDEKGKFLFQFLHIMTLTEKKGKTRLTMHSRVIAATAGADRYIGGFEMGMTMSLERLGEHLATKTEPLVIEHTFNAPVARVWQAITRQAAMKQWYFDVEKFKPVVGCKFDFTVEHKGVKYCHLCKVTEVIPQKRFAYTWRYKGRPGSSLVSFDLIATGKKTRLRLTHTGLETFPKSPEYARANFVMGWTSLIGDNLKKFLKTKTK